MTNGPYKLPPGWRWVKLEEVVDHQRRSIDPRRFPDELFLLYSIPSYDNGKTPEKVHGKQIGSSKLLIEGGQCLFSKLNPRIPRAWIVHATSSYRQVASTEFMPLKPKEGALNLNYLGKILVSKTFLDQVCIDVTGATGSRQRLKPDVVLDALIPLPPLPEQRRIVARIEALMERVREAKRLREEAKKDADRLMQAALAEVFPRPGGPLPPSWRWVKLGEVCEFRHGGTPSKKHPVFWNGNIPWVSPKDMRLPVITDTRDHITEHALENSSTRTAPKNSILIVVRSGILVRTFPVAIAGRRVAFNQDIKAILPNLSVFNPRFLYWALRSLEPLILSEGVKKGVTVHSIRSGFIENLRVPVPSLGNQRRIVAYLDQIQAQVTALKQAQEATEAELHRLEQAILDKAFRGEL